MSLQAGTMLGHYQVLSAIGAGGMGEVYRARDKTLGREVAIKVLPEELSRDPERLSRFEREAKLLASLNHPAIATLHGLETFRETPFLVMELVEGETLAERIAAGPIPLDEAVALFRQIAEGLEAAHEKGIVHRDLKPANIKIKPDGSVKILDFGLAKALVGIDVESVDTSHSPTLTKGTALGAILGTASYMSPEQARGRAIDKRTDVWAFGCVLYESLTGKKAFDGETVTDILARVVQGTPDFDALADGIPLRIRRLLRRCLEKDRRRRLRDIGEAWYALTDETDDARSSTSVTDREPRHPFLRYGLVAAAAVVALFFVRSAFEPAKDGPPLLPARYTLSLDRPLADLSELAFALSPRGDRIVYVGAPGDGSERLYLRKLTDGEEKELPGTEGAVDPFFSPDGEWVGFFAQGSLQKISLRGGAPALICESAFPWGASWGPDDTIVFVPARNQILSVSANGGVPKEVIRSDESSYRWPSHLPNGSTLLVQNRGGMATVSLETGEQKEIPIGIPALVPRYSATGHVLFVSGNSLYSAPFDEVAGELTGDPVPIREGLRQVLGVANFALAENGTLYFVPGRDSMTSEKSLVWVDRAGAVEPVASLRRAFFMPRLSPGGDAIAVTVVEGVRRDIWIYELATEVFRRLSTEGASYGPVWSPQSDRIAYSFSPRGAKDEIRVVPTDGGGAPEILRAAAEDRGIDAEAWSPDGQTLLYSENRASTDYDLWAIDMGRKSEPTLVASSTAYDSQASFSPDGAWIAYASERTGETEVYVQPFLEPGPPRQVSQKGGSDMQWLSSGELVFLSGERLMSVPIQTTPSLTIGQPTTLLAPDIPLNFGGFRNYDVTPDGQRFLMPRGEDRAMPEELAVIVNFEDELRRLVPAR